MYPFPVDQLPSFETIKEQCPVCSFAVSDLIPTQYVIRIDRMLWLASGKKPEGNDVPHVVTFRGKTYLYDGHHRWTLAKIQGVTWLAVRRVDLDIQRFIPNPAYVAAGPEANMEIVFHAHAGRPFLCALSGEIGHDRATCPICEK